VASFLGKANFFERADGSTYAVRPEKIWISSDRTEEWKQEGTITFISYSGNITSYTIDCNGKEVLCERQNVQVIENLNKGRKIFLSWDAESEIDLEEENKIDVEAESKTDRKEETE
jgi:ABC-type Fe3+/spermidine/putrescine transport system ATPase subunit